MIPRWRSARPVVGSDRECDARGRSFTAGSSRSAKRKPSVSVSRKRATPVYKFQHQPAMLVLRWYRWPLCQAQVQAATSSKSAGQFRTSIRSLTPGASLCLESSPPQQLQQFCLRAQALPSWPLIPVLGEVRSVTTGSSLSTNSNESYFAVLFTSHACVQPFLCYATPIS